MRAVKEKSSLKARAVETLKSAPQTAFRRGTDASFQQLRQELREAAQDGKSDDRYESGKITDTADHAVQEVRHLAEKAAHRLPKTKSEPQREARTESNPQHEQSRQPQQPTVAPKEYPPASARPSYPPQSQPQVSRSVRESASPIREKPVPPASDKQPKMREHTPTADAPVQQPQHTAPQIHENVKAVSTETTPSLTERFAREAVSPVKEKPVPPVNIPQPKMREYAPNADVPVHRPQHPASQIHEKSQVVSRSQVNQPVRELWSSVKEKSAVKAKPAEQRSLGQSPAITEPDVPATTPTTPTVQPSARTLPREKPIVFSPREPLATPKTDTTQFALPAIKTKEYIRKKRKKQKLFKEETSSIENAAADSETFSPVIRTRETVREQQKLHVSHSAEQAQPVMPQIRMRQPQAASMRANTELSLIHIYQNFSAVVPYDLKQQRKETREMLDDLTTRDQRMMFAVVTLVHLADTKEELDSDTETLQSIARKHLCQLSTLNWQQAEGLVTALPLGLRRIDALRTLTTEALAVLMPFKAQEIRHQGGVYYGQNTISKNLILANRWELLNANGFVLGVSGSGKSFTAKREMVGLALAAENGDGGVPDDIIVIDPESEVRHEVAQQIA